MDQYNFDQKEMKENMFQIPNYDTMKIAGAGIETHKFGGAVN